MNNGWKIGFVMLMVVYGCSKAPLPTETTNETVNEFASLRVMAVDVQGNELNAADVFFNGEKVGTTPLNVDSLPFGTHTLRVQKPGFMIYNEMMELASRMQVTREVVLEEMPMNTGQLVLTVDQDSTRITVTNSQNEIVDEDIDRELAVVLEAGGYFVQCQKDGYELVLKAVSVYADSITIENIQLVKMEQANTPQIAIVVPDSGIVSQPVLISWESMHAERIDIDYVENAGLNGKREILFQTAGLHVIHAYAYSGREKVTTTDSILILPAPTVSPSLQFSVNPKEVYVNDPVTLQWSSTNATSVDVDFVPNAGLRGQWQHAFTQPGDYEVTATAYSPGGRAIVVDTVHVLSREVTPPTISVNVSPTDVYVNQPVTIRWHAENANDVRVDFVPNAGLDGQWQTSFGSAGDFIIKAYAYGDGGQAVAADTVHVAEAPTNMPMINLRVDPDTATIGQDVSIRWESTHATRVDVDYVPAPGLNGQWKMSFNQTGTYILNATAYNGPYQTHASDTIVVVSADAPWLAFQVDKTELNFGEPAVIHWESNAEQVVIDYGVGVRGPNGTEELLFPNPGEKVVTAVAYGPNNTQTSAHVTIVVREAEQPVLPVIMLSLQDSAQVGNGVEIEWHSINAERVDVDYVQQAGLNGKAEVAFLTAGTKVVTATAYNAAGTTTVSDTIYVVEKMDTVPVIPLIVPSGATVCAEHYRIPQVVEQAGTIEVDRAGYYQVWATMFYNSGDDQKNESCFITIDHQGPENPNAGSNRVMPDDPGTPHTAERDAGIFYLTPGSHTIQLHHYATIADQYPQFVVDGPISGPESIEVLFFLVEFLRH